VVSLRCDRPRSLDHKILHPWSLQSLVSLRLCGGRFGNPRFRKTHIRSFRPHLLATLAQEFLLQSILRLHGRNHDLLHSVPFECHGLDP
jgi:hypothetical protein